VIEFPVHEVNLLPEEIIMFGFVCSQQVTIPGESAIDIFLFDDLLHGAD
jgi:hypothetical protein